MCVGAPCVGAAPSRLSSAASIRGEQYASPRRALSIVEQRSASDDSVVTNADAPASTQAITSVATFGTASATTAVPERCRRSRGSTRDCPTVQCSPRRPRQAARARARQQMRPPPRCPLPRSDHLVRGSRRGPRGKGVSRQSRTREPGPTRDFLGRRSHARVPQQHVPRLHWSPMLSPAGPQSPARRDPQAAAVAASPVTPQDTLGDQRTGMTGRFQGTHSHVRTSRALRRSLLRTPAPCAHTMISIKSNAFSPLLTFGRPRTGCGSYKSWMTRAWAPPTGRPAELRCSQASASPELTRLPLHPYASVATAERCRGRSALLVNGGRCRRGLAGSLGGAAQALWLVTVFGVPSDHDGGRLAGGPRGRWAGLRAFTVHRLGRPR